MSGNLTDLLTWIGDQMQALPEHRTPAAHGKAELLRDLRAHLDTRPAAPPDTLAAVRALADELDEEFADRLIRSNATPKITYRAILDRLRAALAAASPVAADREERDV